MIADKMVGRATPGTEPDAKCMPSLPDGTVTMLHHPLHHAQISASIPGRLENNADNLIIMLMA